MIGRVRIYKDSGSFSAVLHGDYKGCDQLVEVQSAYALSPLMMRVTIMMRGYGRRLSTDTCRLTHGHVAADAFSGIHQPNVSAALKGLPP
jgi:hypothetical protein